MHPYQGGAYFELGQMQDEGGGSSAATRESQGDEMVQHPMVVLYCGTRIGVWRGRVGGYYLLCCSL